MSEVGKSIIAGLEDAVAYAKGDKSKGREYKIQIPDTIDVKGIRANTGMSQSQFADFYGFKVSALQAWEQGRRKPDRTARILLAVIEKNPSIIHDTLAA